MVDMDFITKINGVYIVHRKINGKDLVFGTFNKLDDATSFRDECDEDGWLLFGNEKQYSTFLKNSKKTSYKTSEKSKKPIKVKTKENNKNIEPLKYKIHVPFFNISLENDEVGTLKSGNTPLQLNLSQLSDLIKRYKSGEAIRDLMERFDIGSRPVLERFISRYFEGDFDKFIKNFNEKSLSSKNKLCSLNSKFHKPYYNLNLHSQDKGKLKSGDYTLKFTIDEIKEIYDRFNRGEHIDKLKKDYNCSRSLIERTIFRFEAGDFDEVILKYESMNQFEKENNNRYQDNGLENNGVVLGIENNLGELEGFNNDYQIINNESNSKYRFRRKVEPLKHSNYLPFGNITFVNDEKGTLKVNNSLLQLTLSEILDLIYDYNKGESLSDLVYKYDISVKSILERFISRYFKGDFDDFISIYVVDNKKFVPSDINMGYLSVLQLYKSFGDFKLISVKNGNLISRNNSFKFNISKIIKIYESFNKGMSVKLISEKYDISVFCIYRLIFRFKVGDFNKVIITYLNHEKNSKLDSLKYKFNPFREVRLISPVRGTLRIKERDSTFKKLPYTIDDILEIISKYDNKEKINDLIVEYGLDRLTIERLIQRYKEGDFDEVIREYKNNKLISVPEKLSYDYNFYVPYKNLSVDSHEGYIIQDDVKLIYTIDDILDIYSDYNDCISIDDLSKKYKLSKSSIERIIARYHEGDFDDVIKQFNEQKYNTSPDDVKTHEKDKISSTPQPYMNLTLYSQSEGILRAGTVNLKLTVDEILYVNEKYTNGALIDDLAKEFKVSRLLIERIVDRYQKGDFNKVIEQYKNNDIITNDLDVLKYNNKLYKDLKLVSLEEGTLKSGSVSLKFTINEILDIYERYENGEYIDYISENYETTRFLIERIIYNYQKGIFEDVIAQYQNQKVSHAPIKPNNESYQQNISKPYKNLKLYDSEGSIQTGSTILKLKIPEILEIHKKHENGISVEELCKDYNCSPYLIERKLKRYLSGDFKEVIEEYEKGEFKEEQNEEITLEYLNKQNQYLLKELEKAKSEIIELKNINKQNEYLIKELGRLKKEIINLKDSIRSNNGG